MTNDDVRIDVNKCGSVRAFSNQGVGFQFLNGEKKSSSASASVDIPSSPFASSIFHSKKKRHEEDHDDKNEDDEFHRIEEEQKLREKRIINFLTTWP